MKKMKPISLALIAMCAAIADHREYGKTGHVTVK